MTTPTDPTVQARAGVGHVDAVRRDAVGRRRTPPAGARRPTVVGDRQPGAGRRGEARPPRSPTSTPSARPCCAPCRTTCAPRWRRSRRWCPACATRPSPGRPSRSPRHWSPSTRRPTASTSSSATCSTPAGCRSARWPSTCSRPRSPTSSRPRCTARTCPSERVRVDIPADLVPVRRRRRAARAEPRQHHRQRRTLQPARPAGAGRGRVDRQRRPPPRRRPRHRHRRRPTAAGSSSRSSGSATHRSATASGSACRSPTGSSPRWAASLTLDDTPGGGLTVTIVLPQATDVTMTGAAR